MVGALVGLETQHLHPHHTQRSDQQHQHADQHLDQVESPLEPALAMRTARDWRCSRVPDRFCGKHGGLCGSERCRRDEQGHNGKRLTGTAQPRADRRFD